MAISNLWFGHKSGFNAVVEKTPGVHKVAAVAVPHVHHHVPHHHGGHHGHHEGPHYGGHHGGHHHGGYGHHHGPAYAAPVPVVKPAPVLAAIKPAIPVVHHGYGGHYGPPHHHHHHHGHVASGHAAYGNHVTHYAPKVSYAPAIAAVPVHHHGYGHGYGHGHHH